MWDIKCRYPIDTELKEIEDQGAKETISDQIISQ